MLNFLIDYLDSEGVDRHTSFQANAGRQHRRLAAVQICRRLKAEGCTPRQITCIPGDYSLKELEQLCENGLRTASRKGLLNRPPVFTEFEAG